MPDATLDAPEAVTVSSLDVVEIIIRPKDKTISVFVDYLDANGDSIETSRARNFRVDEDLFNQVMGAWVQANPRKKLLDAMKAADKLGGITTT